MSKQRVLNEGEVEHALRLFAGRQLCDRCCMEPADAMAYVLDYETELVEAMAEAVSGFHDANLLDDDPVEDEW